MEYGDNLISQKLAINAVKAVPINGWVKDHLTGTLECLPAVRVDYKTDHGYMWLCPVCGLSNHSDFGECVRCGHKRPDAKPEPKKGKWIVLKHSHNARCSKCHQTFVDAYDLENWDNYCRHCGAVMESIVAEEEWNE